MLRRKELARKIVRLIARKLPKKKEAVLSVDAFLTALLQAYRKDRLVRNFFLSPKIDKREKEKLLAQLGKKYGVPKEVLEVFNYVVEINAFALLPEIKRLYEVEMEKLMNMLKGELRLARKLDKRTLEKLNRAINKLLGREIELEVKEDPSLIGGFVFKTHAYVLDTSVKSQLERLARRGGV
ncbi:MAG: ATP synthase F1 subunit delta [Aquificae bacterium]|nr:ATP synthase F1 subunit delta [Aquificota bacterium]